MQIQQLFRFQAQISKKLYKTSSLHPVTTLDSLKQSSSCTYCQVMKGVCDDLQIKSEELTQQYNKAVELCNKLSNCIDCVIYRNQQAFQNLQKQLENCNNLLKEQQQQYDSIIKKKQTLINELYLNIMQNEKIIDQLQHNCYQGYNKQNSIEIQNRQLKVACESLSKHRRDRSKLFNTLQSQNANLQNQNTLLKQQNIRLQQQIRQMSYEIQHLSQNLLMNNITTPRVIVTTEQNHQDNSLSEFQSIQRQQGNNSLDEQSVIPSQNRDNTYVMMKNYSTESLMENQKGNPLKDVLNLSSGTNEYFKFTHNSIRKYNPDNTCSEQGFCNSGQFYRSVQDIKKQENSETNKTVHIFKNETKQKEEIQQFSIKQKTIQQEDSCSYMLGQSLKPSLFSDKSPKIIKYSAQKKQSAVLPSITIDPYYAFFTLTIQCIKLNWKNMDEVANIDLSGQWDNVLQKGIQMNLWAKHLQLKMKEKVNENILKKSEFKNFKKKYIK